MMEMTIPVTMIATMMMMTMEIEVEEEEIMMRMKAPGEVSRGKESNMHQDGQNDKRASGVNHPCISVGPGFEALPLT